MCVISRTMKCLARVVVMALLSGVLILGSSLPAAALSNSSLEMMNLNGINYYNPEGGDNCVDTSQGANVMIIGDEIIFEAKSKIEELLPDVQIYAQMGKAFGEPSDTARNPDGTSVAEKKSASGGSAAGGTTSNGGSPAADGNPVSSGGGSASSSGTGAQPAANEQPITAQGAQSAGSGQAVSGSGTASTQPTVDPNPTAISILKGLAAQDAIPDKVVIALGWEVAPTTKTVINSIVKLAGKKTDVFFVTNYSTDKSQQKIYKKDNKLYKTAAKKSNVSVIDWAKEAKVDTAKYLVNQIYPTDEGQKLLADMISGAVGGASGMSAGVSGDFTNYAGDKVLSKSAIAQLKKNIPIYQEAIKNTGADKKGFTWQILATIHYRESSLGWRNPSNGQGIWQLYDLYKKGTRFPPGKVGRAEFLRQTELALKGELFGKAKGLDLTKDDDVKRFFFKYNGTAKKYVEKAKNMGYSDKEAQNGEGSPYVMNGFDAKRDPFHPKTMSAKWRGGFCGDHKWCPNWVSKQYGSYTLLKAMGGGGAYSMTTSCESDEGSLKIWGDVTGGLNESQTKALLKKYQKWMKSDKNCSRVGVCESHKLGRGENCVDFVKFFIAMFTTVGKIGRTGNGNQVVGTLTSTYKSKGFKDCGKSPKVWAIFSHHQGTNGWGHTGVIMGMDEKYVYIGQSSYSHGTGWALKRIKKPISEYTGHGYTYACTDSIVEPEKIQKFLNTN